MVGKLTQKKRLALLSLFFLSFLMLVEASLIGRRLEIRKKAAGTGEIKVFFDSTTQTLKRNVSYVILVKLQNAGNSPKRLRTAGVDINFPPAVFEPQELDLGCANANDLKNTAVATFSANQIFLSCFRNPADGWLEIPPSANKYLGSFRLKVKENAPLGSATVSFSRTKVPDAVSSIDLADSGTAANFTIGPAEGEFKLKVKMRGVESKPPAFLLQMGETLQGFRIKFVKDGKDYLVGFSGYAVAGDAGLWTIPVSQSNLTPGTYDLYLKGPKHLQKKIPGVILQLKDDEVIDLTSRGEKYFLEPGDLPIGPNAEQDGVVNALDAVYLTNCFATPEDKTCLEKADLNFDGLVNTLDMNLLNATVFTRWEDELE